MKTLKQSILFFIFMTVILGGVYPLVVMGISNVLFSHQSHGGMLSLKEQVVGSDLIAQEFSSEKFFWGRPSAASYNANASSGSNYALTNSDYQKLVMERKTKGLDYDLLTTSGSGLDPHITPRAALLQVARVAEARKINTAELTRMVNQAIEKRQWGFLGEERVNVLKLNLNLERLANE